MKWESGKVRPFIYTLSLSAKCLFAFETKATEETCLFKGGDTPPKTWVQKNNKKNEENGGDMHI